MNIPLVVKIWRLDPLSGRHCWRSITSIEQLIFVQILSKNLSYLAMARYHVRGHLSHAMFIWGAVIFMGSWEFFLTNELLMLRLLLPMTLSITLTLRRRTRMIIQLPNGRIHVRVPKRSIPFSLRWILVSSMCWERSSRSCSWWSWTHECLAGNVYHIN